MNGEYEQDNDLLLGEYEFEDGELECVSIRDEECEYYRRGFAQDNNYSTEGEFDPDDGNSLLREISNQKFELNFNYSSTSNKQFRAKCLERLDYLLEMEEAAQHDSSLEIDSLDSWRYGVIEDIQKDLTQQDEPEGETRGPKKKLRLCHIPDHKFEQFWKNPTNQAIMNNVARRYLSYPIVRSEETTTIKMQALWRTMSNYDSNIGNWNGFLKAVTTSCFKDIVYRTPKQHKLINEMGIKITDKLDAALSEYVDDLRSADGKPYRLPNGKRTTPDIEQKVSVSDTDISKETNAFRTLREFGDGFELLIDHFETGLTHRELAEKYNITTVTVGRRLKKQLSMAKAELTKRGLDMSSFLA